MQAEFSRLNSRLERKLRDLESDKAQAEMGKKNCESIIDELRENVATLEIKISKAEEVRLLFVSIQSEREKRFKENSIFSLKISYLKLRLYINQDLLNQDFNVQ